MRGGPGRWRSRGAEALNAATAPDTRAAELPRVEAGAPGSATLLLRGSWTLRSLAPRVKTVERALAAHAGLGAAWDARDVLGLDTTGAALLWRAWGRRPPERLLLRPEQEALFETLARGPGEPAAPAKMPLAARSGEPVVALGALVLSLGAHAKAMVGLLGQLLLDALALLRAPGRIPWRECSANLYRAGATALPITAMVGFLIGIVVSYLSAQQLRTFGANVLIVNLLGISVLRELGPLLAAILVAGRSGSAITAQIGVMHVTQELDALQALGISPTLRLVWPRVVALAVALPLLVVWTDAVALWGGILASDLELGIGVQQFVQRLPDVVPVVNLWIGVAKGAVFGILIALVACHHGLRIEPNTESLGAGTTASVVTSITLVLVADAVFAVALSGVGMGTLR